MSTRTESAARPDDALPGEPVPYRLEAGGGRRFVQRGLVSRVLATGDETAGALAVTMVAAPPGPPIPPHFHEPRVLAEDRAPEPVALVQHDFTYCIQGRVKVWVDGECRILGAGDAVSIAPGAVHSSQMLDHYTELLAPVVPPGWIRFLELLSTPYDGSAYPAVDDSPLPPPERFAQAVAEGLLTPVEDFVRVEPDLDAPDDRLPGRPASYFLRAGEGPRHVLFGQVCFQLLTGAESGGRLAVTVTEGPKRPPIPRHVHERTHECVLCLEGRMRIVAGGEEHRLIRGDFVSIPPGTEHTYALESDFTRFVTMTAPTGTERLHEVAGDVAEQRIFPPAAALPDLGRLRVAAEELDIVWTD